MMQRYERCAGQIEQLSQIMNSKSSSADLNWEMFFVNILDNIDVKNPNSSYFTFLLSHLSGWN